MQVLVTGSSGHLGEALVRTLQFRGIEVIGLDLKPSPYTAHLGSIADKDFVEQCVQGVDVIYHTATLHKPHVATHSKRAFVDTNIQGTLHLLEAALKENVSAFIYTSTTSTFGDALRPDLESPAAWVTEDLGPIPRNIYGVTKLAAEDLCELFHRKHGLPCLILRTSRFFPEEDDDKSRREDFEDANLKLNELLYRRVDLEDVVSAHLLASERAERIGFGRYIISATSPFSRKDARTLRTDLPSVLEKIYPDYPMIYQNKGWKMLEGIDRIYDSSAATRDLSWLPKYTFGYGLSCMRSGQPARSKLADVVGSKGYHDVRFEEGPYPVLD
ncbi:MAG: NAD(P)-dependent oxidoreductase [Verrucomicrobiota bacterium]